MPEPLRNLADADGYLKLGPIPKGTPINLVANLYPNLEEIVDLKVKLGAALLKVHALNLTDEAATAELIRAVPELIAANRCPDFIEDKGHYFGTKLPDADKRALIEYLKTL